MSIIFNKENQKETRRQLRQTATKQEKILWEKLRNRHLEVKFRRQHGIGNYIVDFCSIEAKLIIEIDGENHNENEQKDYDAQRTDDLKFLGFKVIRFWNYEIEQKLDYVLQRIKIHLKN